MKKQFSFLLNVSLLIVFFSIIIFQFNCGEKQKEDLSEISYPLETAKMISQVTSGFISSNQTIKVRFVSLMIEDNLVGEVLQKSVFSFQPKIEGLTKWEDKSTLVFQPNNPLPLRQNYSGSLDVASLLPQHKDKALEPFEFNFRVAGRELAAVTGDFKLQNSDEPKFLIYEGTISFTENTNLEDVQRSTRLRMNSQNLDLTLDASSDGKNFTFKSPVIEREQSVKNFVFTINKNPLDLSEDFEKRFVLNPISELMVVEISKKMEGETAGLIAKFSDELDTQKDVRGLIRTEPQIEIDLKTVGKEIHISGNFEYGQEYAVHINQGIRSKWGTTTEKDHIETIQIEDIKPQIRFASDGVFLTSANEQKINFMTVNLKRVKLNIQKVFESNIGQFLQTEQLNSTRNRNQNFNTWELRRVGVNVTNDTLEIGYERNEWLQHELDLKTIIPENEKGLFLISLLFDQKDMIYGDLDEKEQNEQNRRPRRYGGRNYYSDPYSPGYVYRNGRIYKPVILSDIGLMYKKSAKRHLVYATNIIDVSPMSNVEVSLLTYQNQLIAKQWTNSEGFADFQNVDQEVFYVLGEKEDQRSVIKLNEMAWNLSSFDTGGETITPDGIRAFIYTERGVYRPGDEVNISLITRNQNNTFPENHPVTMKIFNPKNQNVSEQIQKESIDGFYSFKFQSSLDDFTGNWRAKFWVGSKEFNHTLKIETVAPYRLKVILEPEKEKLAWSDKNLSVDLTSIYLFGNPAANLNADVNVSLNNQPKTFDQFRNYSFSNETIDYKQINTNIFQGRLNLQGKAKINWSLPSLRSAPSSIVATVTAKVFEKGGRPNQNFANIPIDPFPFYVGLLKPDIQRPYMRVGSALQIPVILVDTDGNPTAGKSLTFRIYKNSYYWWWEYENRRDFRLRFKSDRNTQLLKEGNLLSTSQPAQLEFTPEDRGEYLIEVSSNEDNAHTAGFFLRAYAWGEVPSSGDQADVLVLKTDKQSYTPGEKAMISFPSPSEGKVLVSVEKAYKIVSSEWYETENENEETTIEIPVTENLIPNAYLSVAIIQPHNQTINDRPMRMYGIVPINVSDQSTRQELEIKTTDQFEPNQSFDVELQTNDRAKTQFTIAVVDEGLLDITQFKTPDPWSDFFKKQRLGVNTYDLFSHIINANKGDIFKTFSIGGDMEMAYRESQLGDEKTKRFESVSMFQGSLFTDDNGYAKVTFDMPNYVGSVRVMVIFADQNRYGSAEKTVPVKSDLMVLPNLPRVLGPDDEISVPVTVFAMEDDISEVSVSIDVSGPIQILGDRQKNISFTGRGEQDVYFQLKADAAIGTSSINISATSGNRSTKEETDLTIRASSPRIFESQEKEIKPGETISFIIPDKGLPGTNEAKISIRRRPNLNFSNRLLWLIHYPYGCIEQTISSVFPQLYLKDIIKTTKQDEEDIDHFINAGIERLRIFQLPSGAFGYWPGSDMVSIWGTNYGGHFLVEAQKLGYNVPIGLINNWLRYQKSQSLTTKDNLLVRVYRVYLLALAGEPQFGAMNLLKENNLKNMSDTQKWLLASAYKLAGAENTGWEIIKNTPFEVEEYLEFGGTYGSGLRDKAMILEMVTLFKRWQDANTIAEELAYNFSSETWYSTQTTGYMLLALGKYFKALEGESQEKPNLAGSINLPNNQTESFETEEINHTFEITEGFGEQIELTMDQKSTVELAFVNLEWNGVPLRDESGDLSKNLTLSIEWLDEDGMPINVSTLTQGKTFWGHFKASKPSTYRSIIEELALIQILPAGWEIENIRLSGEDFPNWMSKYRLNQQEYVDIRDDRIMWFFDMRPNSKELDFVVKLNAVSVGEFKLPPTILEAMYNNNYQARKAGNTVRVTRTN